jgi:hypothetical protein
LKKIVVLLLAFALLGAMAGAYGPAITTLSKAGTNRFLDELESLSLRSDTAGYCARLHEQVTVSIKDDTGEPPAHITGGKTELCEYVAYAAKAIPLLGIETRSTRENYEIERSWLHPWTVRVTYHELRVSAMTKQGVTVHTESDDAWTLVQTLRGVRVVSLQSRSRIRD